MVLLHKNITDIILKSYYKVFNNLGYGFLEKVYENALLKKKKKQGLVCEKQKPIKVYYDEIQVGEYYADIIVNECIIIELKAAESLAEEHEFQLINYLKATDIEVGLVLNFGKNPQFKRKIFTNNKKNQ